MSPKPMSFTANIDFMDEDGKRFSMSVTGTTDNSLLTHSAFMQVRGVYGTACPRWWWGCRTWGRRG